jgi:two-component system LytT family response regulator
MRAIIVDDETKARDTLKGLLEILDAQVEIVGEAATVNEGESLLRQIEADVLFLDIELADGSGFEILNRLGKIKPKVVFTTAYDNHAVEAFRKNAIDYLLKPISLDELSESLDKVREFTAIPQQSESIMSLVNELKEKMTSRRIAINSSNKMSFVEVNDIIYCKSESAYSTVFMIDGSKIMSTSTLKSLEADFVADGFFRVNNSYLVNLSKIKTFNKTVNHGVVILENGDSVEVSRRKKAELMRLLKRI